MRLTVNPSIRLDDVLQKLRDAAKATLAKVPDIVAGTTNTPEEFAAVTKPDSVQLSADRVSVRYADNNTAFDIKAAALLHATKRDKHGYPYADIPLRVNVRDIPPDVRAKMEEKQELVARLRLSSVGLVRTKTLNFGEARVSVEVRHKRGLYADVIKNGSSWNTIRRISRNSDPTSWWYPGKQERDVFDVAAVKDLIKQCFLEKLKGKL